MLNQSENALDHTSQGVAEMMRIFLATPLYNVERQSPMLQPIHCTVYNVYVSIMILQETTTCQNAHISMRSSKKYLRGELPDPHTESGRGYHRFQTPNLKSLE